VRGRREGLDVWPPEEQEAIAEKLTSGVFGHKGVGKKAAREEERRLKEEKEQHEAAERAFEEAEALAQKASGGA
jgi:hypothetical protein